MKNPITEFQEMQDMLDGQLVCTNEEVRRYEELKVLADRYQRFIDVCPKDYRESDLSRFEKEPVDQIMKWECWYGTGLLVVGYTGLGKTRTCWQLVKNLMMAGVGVKFVQSVSLFGMVSDAVRGGRDYTLAGIVRAHSRIRVLVIDDFGKEPFTPTYLATLYEIIDNRIGNGLPIIMTTNMLFDQLVQKIGDDTISIPLLERIKRTTAQVVFK